MASVTLHDVAKVYPGGVRGVDGVSLDIADREFLVLVGPSGCGKSTTLRMIAGLEDITAGVIRIDGRAVNDVPPRDRDIAMVFQNYALYPHMTVYKNMAFGLKLRRRELGLRRADIDKKVRDTARLLGIEDLLDRKPRALSGGQRQRVAVGRAIVRNPKVFLFDEPLSNLDAKLRMEMRSEIKRLQRRFRTTTVYVTHDQEEAMTLGDRVVVMKDGRVHQAAPPLEIYERPANRFVASFVGTPTMNFLDGLIVLARQESGDGGLAFDDGSTRFPLPSKWTALLRSCVGRAMVLGIRPDAIGGSPQSLGVERGASVRAKVELIEPLGDRKDVYMRLPSKQNIVARVDARTTIEEGHEFDAFIDMSRAHVFECGECGANVMAAVGGPALSGAA